MSQDSTQQTGQSDDGTSSSNNPQVDDSRFDIPQVVREKYADLLELIIATKSMDDKERQYWFHILPVMNEQQVEKLRGILENEKKKLAEIDSKYTSGNADQKPPVREMEEGEIHRKIQKVQEAEQVHLHQEADKEAELLAQLEDL